MTRAIRIYVEGGGNESSKANLREGFNQFLQTVRDRARSSKLRWQVVPSGSREDTYKAFRAGLSSHAEDQVLLLVDSEGEVTGSPIEHLCGKGKGGWDRELLSDENCHLMVQLMEAWFIADVEKLAEFYGQGFRESAIPRTKDVEKVDKKRVLDSLTKATANTSKRAYDKKRDRHASELLRCIRPEKVRQKSRHCARLFTALEKLVTTA